MSPAAATHTPISASPPAPRWLQRRVPGGRILELDALRGLAALSVVLGHYMRGYEKLFDHSDAWAGALAWRHIHHFGVPLFFMLSGFVIPMTLDGCFDRAAAADRAPRPRPFDRLRHRGWPAVREFLVARFARLYPAFVVASVLIYLVTHAARLPDRTVGWRDLLAHFTFFPRELGFRFVDGVYRTLEAELKFYLLAAAVALLGQRRRLALVLGLMIATNILRPDLLQNWAHFFVIGVVCYESSRPQGRGFRWWHAALLALAAARLLLKRVDGGPLQIVGPRELEGFAMLTLAAAIFWVATRVHIPALTGRALLWLGSISYSLYLVHQNIGFSIMLELSRHNCSAAVSMAAALIIAIALAALLAFTVERPMDRWIRRRLIARRSPIEPNQHAPGTTG